MRRDSEAQLHCHRTGLNLVFIVQVWTQYTEATLYPSCYKLSNSNLSALERNNWLVQAAYRELFTKSEITVTENDRLQYFSHLPQLTQHILQPSQTYGAHQINLLQRQVVFEHGPSQPPWLHRAEGNIGDSLSWSRTSQIDQSPVQYWRNPLPLCSFRKSYQIQKWCSYNWLGQSNKIGKRYFHY